MANAEILTIRDLESTPYYSISAKPLAEFDPEKIQTMGNMFNSFGNHEAKALALLALGIKDDITKHQLRSALTRFTGNAWNLHFDSVDNYCRTLKKFGGFTEVEQPSMGLERWQITTTGIGVLPIAAYILLESYRYLIPLTLAFGSSTSANDQHAPANSLLILTNMAVKESPTSIINIVNNTHIKYNAGNSNILRLARLGFIDHDSLTPEAGKGKVKYSVAKEVEEEKIPNLKGKAAYMVRAFYRIIKKANAPLSVDDVVAIVETDTSLDPRLSRLKSLRLVANNVLGALRGLKLLQSNLTATTDQSHISFKEDNYLEEFIREVVPAIGGYLAGELQMVQKLEIAHSFLISQSEEAEFIREFLMNRARSNSFWSPDALKSLSSRVTEVYNFLLDHPNSRIATIAQSTSSSIYEARNALFGLMATQRVNRIRSGRGSYYSAVHSD